MYGALFNALFKPIWLGPASRAFTFHLLHQLQTTYWTPKYDLVLQESLTQTQEENEEPCSKLNDYDATGYVKGGHATLPTYWRPAMKPHLYVALAMDLQQIDLTDAEHIWFRKVSRLFPRHKRSIL